MRIASFAGLFLAAVPMFGHHPAGRSLLGKDQKAVGMPSTGASAGLPSIDPLNVLAVGVQRVEPNEVCMLNERYMADEQIQ